MVSFEADAEAEAEAEEAEDFTSDAGAGAGAGAITFDRRTLHTPAVLHTPQPHTKSSNATTHDELTADLELRLALAALSKTVSGV